MLGRLFPFGLSVASDTSWRVDRVAESSRALASATCSAAIACTTVRRLKATVYQGGSILGVRFRATGPRWVTSASSKAKKAVARWRGQAVEPPMIG
jgi:hypothetical protein